MHGCCSCCKFYAQIMVVVHVANYSRTKRQWRQREGRGRVDRSNTLGVTEKRNNPEFGVNSGIYSHQMYDMPKYD
jgi:hypothetical protein